MYGILPSIVGELDDIPILLLEVSISIGLASRTGCLAAGQSGPADVDTAARLGHHSGSAMAASTNPRLITREVVLVTAC